METPTEEAPVVMNDLDLSNLESSSQTTLLDLIDSLRAQGIGKQRQGIDESKENLTLPQLIVCGDQSSGKSSVLNAITRLRFPASKGKCTTFATELRLRRDKVSKPITATIQPALGRTAPQKARLESFNESLSSPQDFAQLVEKAKEELCAATGGDPHMTYDDVLCVEISGPKHTPLTIVDLPGLIHSSNQGQHKSEGPRIEKMVKSYMANPRSIILAVVSAENDLALQKVLDLAAEDEHDPKHQRTFGIITKPDRIDENVTPDHSIIQLARNKLKPLQLGWHVLRNRGPQEIDLSDEERDEKESDFFQEHPWTEIGQKSLGVKTLCENLGVVLLRQIRAVLPSLVKEINDGIAKCNKVLEELGDSRDSPKEQLAYLNRISQQIQTITRDAISGHYASHQFFANPEAEDGYARRLRAIIQDLNDQFGKCMHNKGHKWDILSDDGDVYLSSNPRTGKVPSPEKKPTLYDPQSLHNYFEEPETKSHSDIIAHTNQLIAMNRGNELPGTTPPSVITDLFRQQSQNWKLIAQRHVELIWDACKDFLILLLDDQAEAVFDTLMGTRVMPVLDELKNEMERKVGELLIPYTRLEPAALSDAFMKRSAEIENERLITRFMKFMDTERRSPVKDGSGNIYEISVDEIPRIFSNSVASFKSKTGTAYSPNRAATNNAAIEAIDQMGIYYSLARDVYIDNICTLAVENCMIDKLPNIVSSQYCNSLSEDELERLAGDAEDVRFERNSQKARRDDLEKALRTIIKHLGPGQTAQADRRTIRRKLAQPAIEQGSSSASNGVSESPTSSDTKPQIAGQKPLPTIQNHKPASPGPSGAKQNGVSTPNTPNGVASSLSNGVDFGKKPAATSGLFSTSNGSTPAPANGLSGFGNLPVNANGHFSVSNGSKTNAAGGFGSKPQAASSFGGFGGNNETSGGFGASNTATSNAQGFGSSFGAANKTTNGFGASTGTANPFGAPLANNTGFGSNTNASGGLFGGRPTTNGTTSNSSPADTPKSEIVPSYPSSPDKLEFREKDGSIPNGQTVAYQTIATPHNPWIAKKSFEEIRIMEYNLGRRHPPKAAA